MIVLQYLSKVESISLSLGTREVISKNDVHEEGKSKIIKMSSKLLQRWRNITIK